MEKMEVTWGLTLKIWWSFVWRAAVFSALVGAILGFIGGVVVGVMGKADLGAMVGGILGYLGSIPVSVWVMKTILEKQFNGYSIAVIKSADV